MKHIVVIDDDMFIRDLVATKLSENYSVAAAENSVEGMELVRRNATDLIILDLEMPGKHGLDVLKELKLDHTTKNIPVVVFSNNPEDIWKPQAMEAGAVDFFVKVNLEMSELNDHIDKILSELST